MYNEYALDGWNDVECKDPKKFVCVCPICNDYHTNITTEDKSNGTGESLISSHLNLNENVLQNRTTFSSTKARFSENGIFVQNK